MFFLGSVKKHPICHVFGKKNALIFLLLSRFSSNRAPNLCIAKGKAYKRYEFGIKVSIAKTRDSGVILGALALPGNPYDGHTIDVVLKQLKRITSTRPDILIADRVYRGGNNFGKNHLLTPSRPAQDDTEYKKRKQRNRFRKRAHIEANISHLKQDFGLGRWFEKGEIGDQINVTLSSCSI